MTLKLIQCECSKDPAACSIHYKHWDDTVAGLMTSTDTHKVAYTTDTNEDNDLILTKTITTTKAVGRHKVETIVYTRPIAVVPKANIGDLVRSIIDSALFPMIGS